MTYCARINSLFEICVLWIFFVFNKLRLRMFSVHVRVAVCVFLVEFMFFKQLEIENVVHMCQGFYICQGWYICFL